MVGYVLLAFGIAFALAGMTVPEALLPVLMTGFGVLLGLSGLALARRHPHG